MGTRCSLPEALAIGRMLKWLSKITRRPVVTKKLFKQWWLCQKAIKIVLNCYPKSMLKKKQMIDIYCTSF